MKRQCPCIATGQICSQVQGEKMMLPDPTALLTRQATANALTAAGYPTSVATLTTKATRGGGPQYHKWGPRVMYRWADALQWAESRLSGPRRNTSDVQHEVAA
jgi:hypothetical protein